MKRFPFLLAFSLFLFLHTAVKAQVRSDTGMMHMDTGHVAMNENELKWTDGPPGLPRGVRMAVLQGDPSKEGMFTLRAMFPANTKVYPHWHPTTEYITVVEGNIYMGTGDKFNERNATLVRKGGFAVMPARMNHYVFNRERCTLQIHAKGPFAITYVNPADDPRGRQGTQGTQGTRDTQRTQQDMPRTKGTQ
jgi:quercetin dioxygenase-like cupin family protein